MGEGMAGQADGFLHDVYDAGMGASRKKYGLTVFFYQQALFVTEIIVCVWSGTEQQSVAGGAETVAGYVSKEEDSIVYRNYFFTTYQTFVTFQLWIETDVGQPFVTERIMRFEGMIVQVYGSVAVYLQKGSEASSVVVMAV